MVKAPRRTWAPYLCLEVEAGQGLRQPKGRTWAPVGARPVVTVRGKGSGRVNMAGVVAYRDSERPHLLYRLYIYRDRKDEPKSISWLDYRDLGVWSLLRRAPLANFAVADLAVLVRITKRKLKQIQYRPHLLTGSLAQTGLTLDAPANPPMPFR
ncbi:hypothetical protein GCM10009733_106010 [Nonomuraea maheshkhaliensis]|uniref:Transposase n=1 Tax=Nonomuraea maheshkhaliensis TaxID=419590 RepID=A0ABP4TSN6_9ACTN